MSGLETKLTKVQIRSLKILILLLQVWKEKQLVYPKNYDQALALGRAFGFMLHFMPKLTDSSNKIKAI